MLPLRESCGQEALGDERIGKDLVWGGAACRVGVQEASDESTCLGADVGGDVVLVEADALVGLLEALRLKRGLANQESVAVRQCACVRGGGRGGGSTNLMKTVLLNLCVKLHISQMFCLILQQCV